MRGLQVDANAIAESSAGCNSDCAGATTTKASTSRALGQRRLLAYADNGADKSPCNPVNTTQRGKPKAVPFSYQSDASAYMLCVILTQHHSDASQAITFLSRYALTDTF